MMIIKAEIDKIFKVYIPASTNWLPAITSSFSSRTVSENPKLILSIIVRATAPIMNLSPVLGSSKILNIANPTVTEPIIQNNAIEKLIKEEIVI